MEEKTKKCSRCGQEKPLSEFPTNKSCSDGHAGQCKKCICELAKERRHKKKFPTPPNPGSAQLNPKFKDKTPRELQDDLRELKLELIARGFNCEIDLTFLHKIKI